MKIQDARAVVTGGASGLGNAVARHVAAAGGKVTLLDVQEGPGRAAATAHRRARQLRALRRHLRGGGRIAAMEAAHDAHGRTQSARQLRRRGRRRPGARQERADGGRVLHQGHSHQPHRHLPVRQGGGGHHAEQCARRRRRARPPDPHLLGGRLRRTDRPGRLLRHQGGGRRHDAADRARAGTRSASAACRSRPASSTRR